jgi:hypothetical protein
MFSPRFHRQLRSVCRDLCVCLNAIPAFRAVLVHQFVDIRLNHSFIVFHQLRCPNVRLVTREEFVLLCVDL